MRSLILFCLIGLSLGYEDKSVTQYLQDNGYVSLSNALQATGLTAALNGGGTFIKTFWVLHVKFKCKEGKESYTGIE